MKKITMKMIHSMIVWVSLFRSRQSLILLSLSLSSLFLFFSNQSSSSFHCTDRMDAAENNNERATSGATATVCLLKNSTQLVVGYVGDSRAFICRDGSCFRLTNDHNANVKTEKVIT